MDFGTHGMFICSITEARVISNAETMTYTYYQNNVKPSLRQRGRRALCAKFCGYIYEGDVLPDDFICRCASTEPLILSPLVDTLVYLADPVQKGLDKILDN